MHGYVIAACLYATAYALFSRWYLNAGAPLALGAFLFTWKRTLERTDTRDNRKPIQRAALRLGATIPPAILVTMIALLFGVAWRNHALAVTPVFASAGNGSHSRVGRGTQILTGSISGYESIVLWPAPEKKQIVVPLAEDRLLARGMRRPLVIHFDGAYWYFQPPAKHPGPEAHQAHGTPLAADIRSNNTLPLTMEARQNLAAPIRLARCREIQVAIENRNNTLGLIAMALLLTNSSAPGKPSIYLGQQPIFTSVREGSAGQSSIAQDRLRFFVPAQTHLREFDTITVMFFPETGSFRVAPQIAIDQFSLIPR